MKNITYILSKILLLVTLVMLSSTMAYSQDPILPSQKAVIIIKNGKQLEDVQLWELHSNILVYERNGSLHDVLIADVEKIRMPDADYFFNSNDSLEQACAETAATADSINGSTDIDIPVPKDVAIKSNYLQGYIDAQKYYDGTGAAIGGFVSGMIPVLGWFVTMPIISSTSPQMYDTNNPNLAKLTDKDYREGYKKKATGKKLGNALGGFGAGLTTLILLLL
jgi:hypothetical protein